MKFITVIRDKRTYESFILLSLRIKCLVAWKKKSTDIYEETPAFIFWIEVGGSVLGRQIINFIYVCRFYARNILCEAEIANMATCENLMASTISAT